MYGGARYASGDRVYYWNDSMQRWEYTCLMAKDAFDQLPEATHVQLRDNTGSPGLQFEAVCNNLA